MRTKEQCKYRLEYINIIKIAKNKAEYRLKRKQNKTAYYEAHHILMKSLYPNWVKKDSNIVLLTAKEHYYCHWLLSMFNPCTETICAFWIMSHDKNKKYISKEKYAKARILFSKININKGRKHNDISKQHMSEAHIGIKLSDEAKQKLKKFWTGRKRGKPSEESINKMRSTLKRRYANNEIVVWNKNKRLSKEHKLKISNTEKGKKLSDLDKKKIGEASHRLNIAKGKLFRYYKDNIDNNMHWHEFIKIYKNYFNINKNTHSIYVVLEELGIK